MRSLSMFCAAAFGLLAVAVSGVVAADEKPPPTGKAGLPAQAVASVASAGQPVLTAHVDESVQQEMRASAAGKAYILVMLRPSVARGPMNEPQRLASIKAQQDAVIGKLATAEFAVRYQYKNFVGFTGVVDAVGLAKLAADPNVMAIGSDEPVHAVLDASVPFINADQVHADLGVTGLGTTVAVLDTGIDMNHPDLSDNIAAGAFTFLDSGATQIPGGQDDNGHGTNVAGIITSKGVVASIGVAPDADILSVKVLNSDGDGFLSDWVAGIDYVVSIRSNFANLCVINMSLASNQLFSLCPCDNSSTFNQMAQAAILAAKDAGIMTFAATGNNSSCGGMGSPACLSSAVAVAAVSDPSNGTPDRVTGFSNRSACNDLAAPGNGITGPRLGGGVSTFVGTSQATPHVAGVAALMCSRCGPGFTGTDEILEILETMRSTGVSTIDACSITPHPIRVDAFAAVEAITTLCVEGSSFSQLPFCECNGDLDGDGVIESSDLDIVQNCVADDCSGCVNSCDVDCDGDVDTDDVDTVACRLAGDPAELCCPPEPGEDIESNVDWVDHLPNVVVADDFVSDGRPITGVRWWGSVLGGTGCPGFGDCCDLAGNGTPGCSDAACCDAVCAIDSFCCETTWDTTCTLRARELCAVCTEPEDSTTPGSDLDQPGVVEPSWDGWFISFHLPEGEPLALYYCDQQVVSIAPTSLPACDGHPVEEYRVDLDACCLVHSNIDPRTGLLPGARNAFLEDECSNYLIDIEAVVGHRFVFDSASVECIEQPTGRSLDGAFWGWHTAPRDSGSASAIETSVSVDNGFCVGGTNADDACAVAADCPGGVCDGPWLYGPWVPVVPACSPPNMAFELITRTQSSVPDCNHNHIPDQCETDCQPNGVPDDCDINGGGSPDNDGNGIPDECECCVPGAPRDVKIPDSIGGNPLKTLTTNRTLIFQAGDDPGCNVQAIRVTFVDLASPYDLWNGKQLWLGPPVETSEVGGNDDATPPTKTWSNLECTPECRGDWGTFGELHVYHEGIVPGSVYEIQVVDCSATGCLMDEKVFSLPLELSTSAYGDTVRDCVTTPCSPPQGAPVNLVDAIVVLDAFVSASGAPRKARVDLEPIILDRKVNISDALQVLRGFSGLPYPFVPSAGDPCP